MFFLSFRFRMIRKRFFRGFIIAWFEPDTKEKGLLAKAVSAVPRGHPALRFFSH
jgi:hypothetical protein